VGASKYVVTTENGEVVESFTHMFDVRNDSDGHLPRYFGAAHDLQDRFDSALGKADDLGPEDRMATAMTLLHMRRWVEAVTLSSAVVDELG